MIEKLFKKCARYLWHLFLNGLLTLLPIVITVGIFSFVLRLIKGWLRPLQCVVPHCLHYIPHADILMVIGFILIVGAVLKSFVLRSIVELFETLINNIPLVRIIYTGVKQMTQAFSPHNKLSFQKVVFVQFPRLNTYSVGFLTSELPLEMSPIKEHTLYNIFVPTTPNPTTGFFIAVSRDSFVESTLTIQEAMALIISGGIIQPERFKSTETTVK